jgi:hypothetical protein
MWPWPLNDLGWQGQIGNLNYNLFKIVVFSRSIFLQYSVFNVLTLEVRKSVGWSQSGCASCHVKYGCLFTSRNFPYTEITYRISKYPENSLALLVTRLNFNNKNTVYYFLPYFAYVQVFKFHLECSLKLLIYMYMYILTFV